MLRFVGRYETKQKGSDTEAIRKGADTDLPYSVIGDL